MASVSLEGVAKAFGAERVVRELSLRVEDREFMVLVGPSGCGKSTTLRMIAGLEEVDAGRILIGGRDVTDLAPQSRDIAMVFKSYALYPHMTAWRNMAFGLLKTSRLSRREIDARVRAAAEILHIGELLERLPRELSGGQRQRVAIGRALVRQPAVLLFDEPLSNLDAKLRSRMRGELKRLHAELGLTIIYVTHDQIEAMTLGTRVALMSGGRLQQVGAPMALYRDPVNTFVATFVGSPEMALLDCRAQDGAVAHPAFHAPLDVGMPLPGRVVLGLRPEEVSLATTGMARGQVVRAELVGAEALVEIALGDDRLTLRCAVDDAPAPGSEVGLDFDLARARAFRHDTGEAIRRGT